MHSKATIKKEKQNKKRSLVLALLLLAVSGFAKQATNAGSFIVGGEICYTIETYEYDEYYKSTAKVLVLSPEIYWFAMDNLAVGGLIGNSQADTS